MAPGPRRSSTDDGGPVPDHDDEAGDGHAFPPPAPVRGTVDPGQPAPPPQHSPQQQPPPQQPPAHPVAPTAQRPKPERTSGRGSDRGAPEPVGPGARRGLGQYMLLVLAAVLATTLRLPWTVLAAVLAIAAIVVGVMLLRSSRGTPAAARNPLVVAGMALSTFVLFTSGATIVLWPAQSALQACQDRAVTVSAEARCQAEYSDAVTGMFGVGG